MSTETITERVTANKENFEVRAVATGAWGEFALEVADLGRFRRIGLISKNTDRFLGREWEVFDVSGTEVGLGFPTVNSAIIRGAQRLIEQGV